jgi:hypothetical protein
MKTWAAVLREVGKDWENALVGCGVPTATQDGRQAARIGR